jgi:dual specificity phosphatase 12
MTDISVYHLEENDVDQIIPNLWLGNKKAALDKDFLQKNNIKYVINVTDGIHCPFKEMIYYHVPIKDKKMCDPQLKNVMHEYINMALQYINKGLTENVGVLVHCRKGHHRSANIVLIFLMQYLGMGYIPSMIIINNLRPYALRRNTCVNKWVMDYYRKNISSFNK